jgi:hypothetical protein
MLDVIGFLLDLVFDNVFVLAVLFGFISLLFNKIRGAGSPGQPPRSAMPPFSGEGPLGPMARGGMSRGEPAGQVGHPEPQTAPVREVYEAISEMRSAIDMPEADPIEPSTGLRGASKSGQLPVYASSSRLNARNAAQGMIWSEVFGPPRARKPHTARRR